MAIIPGTSGPDYLYGSDFDDSISGLAGNDTLLGVSSDLYDEYGNDSLDGGTGNDSLWGGGGNNFLNGGDGIDTVSYRDASGSINLQLGEVGDGSGLGRASWMFVGLVEGPPTLPLLPFVDSLSGIEVVIGSDFGSNTLVGGSDNETLLGGRRNDFLSGRAGNDLLNGGDGIDTVSYTSATTGINLDLGLGLTTDGLGGVDSLSGLEVVIGSRFNDTLVGGSDNETLLGGRGNDSLWGGAGNDSLNGGDGIDTVSYTSARTGINLDLGLGLTTDGLGGVDSLSGIEVVIGSRFNDTLVGGSGNETLWGGRGNDSLSGLAGNDLLNGGEGIDTVSYSLGRTGVYLQLGAVGDGSGLGRASDGQGGIDSLSGIEVAIGSRYNDTLLGGDGSETLIGGAGDDLLFGFSGNDYLVGGRGADKFRLWRSSGIDTIADFKQGEDKLLVRSRAPFADIVSQLNGSDTEIRQNGVIIGILKGVQITITASDLITG
ncbi:calcium-binding protein [Microcoleus sp. Pol11C3]|uniref:calcium-binding protein n=1 Tax=Microcoleus sp. Pol11C3 TaxID=3055390 RepID=UPI002FD3DF30